MAGLVFQEDREVFEMRISMGFRFLRWIGVKRFVPAVLGFFIPAVREFFSTVEDFRMDGRKGGELDLEETQNMCVLDGIFSMGYATVIGLMGGAVYYLVFEIFKAPGVLIYLNIMTALLFPFLATALVELFDYLRISILSFLRGEGYEQRLIDSLSYLLLFVIFLMAVFCFFLFA